MSLGAASKNLKILTPSYWERQELGETNQVQRIRSTLLLAWVQTKSINELHLHASIRYCTRTMVWITTSPANSWNKEKQNDKLVKSIMQLITSHTYATCRIKDSFPRAMLIEVDIERCKLLTVTQFTVGL